MNDKANVNNNKVFYRPCNWKKCLTPLCKELSKFEFKEDAFCILQSTFWTQLLRTSENTYKIVFRFVLPVSPLSLGANL